MIPFFEDVKDFVLKQIDNVLSRIGTKTDTGGSAVDGTVMAKTNAIIKNTETNNNPSETGTLSQKMSQINTTA